MLEYLFGDTPQVNVIEKIIKSNDDYWHTFPSKNEIINDLEIPKETLDCFDEEFLTLLYLVKYKLSDIYKILTLKDEIDRILPNKPSFNEEFDKISQNYILYKKECVKSFLTNHYGLVNYVNHITPIINRYFKDYPKMIVFHQDPEIDSLSHVGIYIKSSEYQMDKDKEILKELKHELRNDNSFPNEIKFYCSVRLDSYELYFNSAYIREDKNDIDNELGEFLKKNFEIPSDNLYDIEKFISEDQKLVEIIYNLPEIISKEFPQTPVTIDFMKYSLPCEAVLVIAIKTPFDVETSSDKMDIILDEIFKKHESPKNEYFITIDF